MSIAKSSDSSREPNESEADLDISIDFIIIGADALLAESLKLLFSVPNPAAPR